MKRVGAAQANDKHVQQHGHSAVVNVLRTLLERCVPVMIDGEAVKALLSYIDDAAQGVGDISDEVSDATDSGLKLIQVSNVLY